MGVLIEFPKKHKSTVQLDSVAVFARAQLIQQYELDTWGNSISFPECIDRAKQILRTEATQRGKFVFNQELQNIKREAATKCALEAEAQEEKALQFSQKEIKELQGIFDAPKPKCRKEEIDQLIKDCKELNRNLAEFIKKLP